MSDLFTWESHVDQRRLHADTLVVTMAAFVDAGNVQDLLDNHVLNTQPSHVVGRFDADQLIDYRDRRPSISFVRDHYEDYRPPQILLHEVTDADGQRFLLLSGAEPALHWHAMADIVRRIIEATGVKRTVMAHTVPMPTPHTRPVLVSKHASDPDLIPGEDPVFGEIAMAAPFVGMLQYKLGEWGHDVIGLTAHVPQYLGNVDYPDAALALVKALGEVAGLRIGTTELAIAAGVSRAQLNQQVANDEQLSGMVQVLEHQFDEFMNRRALTQAAENLPTADEIGAEAEAFLQSLGSEQGEGDEPTPEEPSEG